MNPEPLRELVDDYLCARMSVLLNLHRLQQSAVEELDAAARAEELRDWWREHPGAIWHDGAERDEEAFWDVEALIRELDDRAEESCDHIARGRPRHQAGGLRAPGSSGRKPAGAIGLGDASPVRPHFT